MEEFGEKESRKMTMDILVNIIVSYYPEMKDPLNKNKFSDYVIHNTCEHFMNDETVKGTHEQKLEKCKELYVDLINAWEELYGTGNESEN